METLLSVPLVTAKSRLPSPSKSPAATKFGAAPVLGEDECLFLAQSADLLLSFSHAALNAGMVAIQIMQRTHQRDQVGSELLKLFFRNRRLEGRSTLSRNP
jgi:hypothetical protein